MPDCWASGPGSREGPSVCTSNGHEELLAAIHSVDSKLDALTAAVCSITAQQTTCTELLSRDTSQSRCSRWEREQPEHLLETEKVRPASVSVSRVSSAAKRVASQRFHGLPSWSLVIRPGFDKTPEKSSNVGLKGSLTKFKRRYTMQTLGSSSELDAGLRWRAWSPDSRSRTVFEVSSMFMLLYDAFVVPYGLAWNLETDESFLLVAIWVTRLFWTLDMFLNLVTGYRDKKAQLVLDPSAAARHYLVTWFVPDLTLVCCDWLTASTLSTTQTWMKYMRGMRLVRGGRQVVRAWTLVMKAKLMIQKHSLKLLLDIGLLMVLLLWVNHVVGCGWYFIGLHIKSQYGTSWLDNDSYNRGPYDYFTALHWAMTQMTPGSMEVVPRSSGERLYNVSVLLLGLLMGSSLVATLTSMLTQYKLRVEGSSKKLMILHQFLIQQGMDPQMALAIQLQVKSRTAESVRLKAKDVEYLSLLPITLKNALEHSWRSRQLSVHPLLNSLELIDPVAMQALSKDCMKSVDFPLGDAVFEEDSAGECIYFVVLGSFRYIAGELAPEVLLDESNTKLLLRPGDWCVEPALWTLWTHLGTLEAASMAEVLTVSGSKMPEVLLRYPVAYTAMADYCRTFHKYINEPGVMKSDLSHTLDTYELISSLSLDTRVQFATPVMQKLEARFMGFTHHHGKMDHLRDEVSNGECDICIVDEEVVRNAFVVALRVQKSPSNTSSFLVKVGEVLRSDGSITAACLLPGIKRKWRESYTDAIDRVLAADLEGVASFVETHLEEGSERTISFMPSPTFGIRTRYLRTVFKATLTSTAHISTVKTPSLQPPTAPPASSLSQLFRPELRRRAIVQKEVATILSLQDALLVMNCEKNKKASKKLYLWLSQSDFEVLSSTVAKPMIEQWLSSMQDELSTRPDPLSAQAAGKKKGQNHIDFVPLFHDEHESRVTEQV